MAISVMDRNTPVTNALRKYNVTDGQITAFNCILYSMKHQYPKDEMIRCYKGKHFIELFEPLLEIPEEIYYRILDNFWGIESVTDIDVRKRYDAGFYDTLDKTHEEHKYQFMLDLCSQEGLEGVKRAEMLFQLIYEDAEGYNWRGIIEKFERYAQILKI